MTEYEQGEREYVQATAGGIARKLRARVMTDPQAVSDAWYSVIEDVRVRHLLAAEIARDPALLGTYVYELFARGLDAMAVNESELRYIEKAQ